VRKESSRLFPCESKFYKYFKSACADLGLSEAYVPHSLRHGGATHDFMRGVPLEEILHLGRWASIKTARIYVQQGRALLLASDVPPDVRLLAKTLATDVSVAMALAQE
jgi:site-specific recombinase XerD